MTGALLTAPEIQAMRTLGKIKIEPFSEKQLNPNSYNVRLHELLRVYPPRVKDFGLDMRKDNDTDDFIIPEEGYVLQPGLLYLGRTVEHTCTNYPIVPMLEGRSSVGRLGLSVHITAGFGDVGFSGTWTLEMTCVHPLRIYPNVEIAQIYYLRTYGGMPKPYNGKYQNEVDPLASKMHEELNARNNTE